MGKHHLSVVTPVSADDFATLSAMRAAYALLPSPATVPTPFALRLGQVGLRHVTRWDTYCPLCWRRLQALLGEWCGAGHTLYWMRASTSGFAALYGEEDDMPGLVVKLAHQHGLNLSQAAQAGMESYPYD